MGQRMVKMPYDISFEEGVLEKYKSEFPDGLLIAGIGNKAIKDSVGDVVLPESYDLRRKDILPLLLNHDPNKVIGRIVDAFADSDGLKVIAHIDELAEEEFKVISKVKKGLLKAFSIGFIPRDVEYDKETDTFYIKDLELLECSLTPIPANYESTITSIKSFLNNTNKDTENTKLNDSNKFKGGHTMDLKVILDEIKGLKESMSRTMDNDVVKDLEAKIKELVESKDAWKSDIEGIKSVIDEVKKEVESVKEVSDEVKSLKETIETLKSELEELKNAKPRIEVPDVDEKTFDENIDSYKDVFLSAQLFKKEYKDTLAFQRLPERLKAVNLDSAFTTKVSKKFLEDIRTNTVVANLFPDFSDVSTTSEEFPFAPEVSASFGSISLSDVDLTKKVMFDLKTLIAGVQWNYAAEEEAIINWMPVIRRKLVEAISDKLDAEICSASPSTGGFTGLLKYANDAGFVFTDASTDNKLTAAKILELKKIMKKYALNPKDAVVILNTTKYLQLLEDANVLTVDKLGDKAVLLTGQLATVYGSPVIVTDNIELNDTDSAGNYSALMVNKSMFGIKMKDIRAEMDKNVEAQNKVLVVSTRVSFVPLVPLSAGVLPAQYSIVAAVENA